jgi:hypothetical protein
MNITTLAVSLGVIILTLFAGSESVAAKKLHRTSIKFKNSVIPWNRIMAYVGYSMKPEQKEVYELLHSHGVMCMISVHPTSEKVQLHEARMEAYRKDMNSRPDIIETDYPSLFAGFKLF